MSMMRQSAPLAASTCAMATLGIVTMNAVATSPAANFARRWFTVPAPAIPFPRHRIPPENATPSAECDDFRQPAPFSAGLPRVIVKFLHAAELILRHVRDQGLVVA